MKEFARFIVSYDITLNKIRTKIEKILKDGGLRRIQYSVFEGILPVDRLQFLKTRLEKLERKSTHSIMIFVAKKPDSMITLTL